MERVLILILHEIGNLLIHDNGNITSNRKRKGFPFLSKLVAASLSPEVGSLSLLLDTAAVGPGHGRWAFFSSCLG